MLQNSILFQVKQNFLVFECFEVARHPVSGGARQSVRYPVTTRDPRSHMQGEAYLQIDRGGGSDVVHIREWTTSERPQVLGNSQMLLRHRISLQNKITTNHSTKAIKRRRVTMLVAACRLQIRSIGNNMHFE